MSDITMCRGESCSIKDECYRYRAEPNIHRQSWFARSPMENKNCRYKVNIAPSDLIRQAKPKGGFEFL